jgi:hypothetical protein
VSEAPADPPQLDVAAIVDVLNRHRVKYVVIGGVAGAAWALSEGVDLLPTEDIDVTPEAGRANLQRLSAALKELDARVRSDAVPSGLPFDHDGESLAKGQTWNLICRHGPIDISIRPSGTGGYDDLADRARVVAVQGIDTPLADLADIIRSKRAADRPKDRLTLPGLEEALRRRDLGRE